MKSIIKNISEVIYKVSLRNEALGFALFFSFYILIPSLFITSIGLVVELAISGSLQAK